MTEMANQLRISGSHLYELERKYQEDPTMADSERPGRPPKITERGESRILNLVRNQSFESATQLTSQYNDGMDEENQIIVSRFKEAALVNGLYARKPSKKPLLQARHLELRLAFVQDYVHKDMRFWRFVLFADESSIQLHSTDNRQRVRRPLENAIQASLSFQRSAMEEDH